MLRHLTALYVEDDPMQRTVTSEWLLSFFNNVRMAENSEDGLRLFAEGPVHLVITDLKMPGMNGLELAAAIRRQDRTVPILMLSAYTETADLLAAARLHLVDYLLKPLSWERLKAALECAALGLLAEGRVFVQLDADTTYCVADGCLHRLEQRIPLTLRERALLDLLAAHRGQWLSKQRLLDRLYGATDTGSEASLKNVILRLRHKIGTDAIVNRYGVGYRLGDQQGTLVARPPTAM
ncbi:response regulator transcription factor [uncultured Thiodictyon sp.]|uniref:response regulator transcription factor n=1 Tax=uncultured Thiodictyon sp. TaxID=1846217 RepID=UPI0025DF7D18|nr:response regulator transcription factor [uncultured Thiodictyon sp.]